MRDDLRRVVSAAIVVGLAFSASHAADPSPATAPTSKWFLSSDYMDDPDHRAAITRAKARAASLDEAGIDRLIRAATLPKRSDDDYWAVVVLEERAVPAMVRALSDPAFHVVVSPYPDVPEVKSADRLAALLQLLEQFAAEPAVAPLAKLVEHKQREVRQQAAKALGMICKPACIAPLRVALRSMDREDRSYAMMGMGYALLRAPDAPKVFADLFDDVARIVDLESVGGTEAPSILMQIDRKRAAKFLQAPERFAVGRTNIGSNLSALVKGRVVIEPGDRIVRLLEDFERSPDAPSYKGECLALLAIARHPSAEARIERAMNTGGKVFRREAADAYLVLHGIPDAYHVAIDAWGGPGKLDRLPEPIRNYVTVHVLNNEIINGALSQYYFNSYSEDVRAAGAGLEAIGAKKTANIIRESIGLFGKSGPAADREQRWKQLESVSEGALESLSEQYEEDPDHLHVLLARYAVAHKELFTKK